MLPLTRGRYVARLAGSPAEVATAQRLRHLCFRGGPGQDEDEFDAACRHVLVQDGASGRTICCLRVMTLGSGAEVGRSYSARFYDLHALRGFEAPMIEIGRFCIHPDHHDPDILRIAWGAVTRIVDENGIGMLFGCSSFKGTRPDAYRDAFARLGLAHLAPQRWRPGVGAAQVFRFAEALAGQPCDAGRAALTMPPLLRTYLLMGGWVSDHAVIDRDLDTMHVFTGLEIAAIPASRARALRMVAG